MSEQSKQRSRERTIDARIERCRRRTAEAQTLSELRAAQLAILDLLDDTLGVEPQP